MLSESELQETLQKQSNNELDLYQRMMEIIGSCLSQEHCDAARKMIEQISIQNHNLAAALMYPLRLKRRVIKNMKSEVVNEES